jgi:hypothetical protein
MYYLHILLKNIKSNADENIDTVFDIIEYMIHLFSIDLYNTNHQFFCDYY